MRYLISDKSSEKYRLDISGLRKNEKKLTDSPKKAKILIDNRKSHHPIETLK